MKKQIQNSSDSDSAAPGSDISATVSKVNHSNGNIAATSNTAHLDCGTPDSKSSIPTENGLYRVLLQKKAAEYEQENKAGLTSPEQKNFQLKLLELLTAWTPDSSLPPKEAFLTAKSGFDKQCQTRIDTIKKASSALENAFTFMEEAFDEIYQHKYQTEERRVLHLLCKGQILKGYPYGLNEIAILKRDSSSMITIHAYINGELLNVYQADGLIVSTPTGSTGYSLSVGGPILVPQSGTISLTPVAPHSLNVRPIVIRDDWEITLQVESRSHNFLVAVDGRSETCREGCQLTIRKANYPIYIVKRCQHSFFNTLREKMMWGADNRK